MVRLQKHFSYKYKSKEHYKHVLTIPEDTIEKLGWKEGDELSFDLENNKIILSKIRKEKRNNV